MPTEPLTTTVASAPTPASPVAGPSRVTYQKRADSKDIPSDDSDTGGSQSPSFKKRFRKRKYIPVPRNLMSMVKKYKSEIVASTPVSQNGSRRTTRDMDGIEIASTSSMCPSPVQEQCSEEDKCSETSQGAVILPSLRNSRFMSNNLLLEVRRWSTVPLDNDANSAVQLRNEFDNSNSRNSGDCSVDNETKCVLYSLWNPSLDFCLKCDNGKLLMEAQQFRQLITESIAHVTPLPDLYKDHNDFEVIYVEGAEVDEENETWKVYGKWCYSNDETSGSNAEINPTPSVIGKILSSMLSASDLLILIKSTSDSHSACFTEKYSCLIHITSKDYKKMCNPLPNHLNLDCMSPMVQSEQNEVQERYGSYIVEKYVVLHDVPEFERNGPLPIEMPTCNGAINATRKDYVKSSSNNNMNGVNTHTSTNNELSLDIDKNRDDRIQEPSVSPTVNRDSELVEVIEESDEDSEQSLAVPVIPRRPSNFSLEYWINEGLFMPGALRPTVKKPDSTKSCYQYHKLMELAVMLNNSVEEDYRNKKIPTMMVAQHCHAYGVVVEVVQEHRHPHSYFFRISDETMESVLVRLHSNEKAIIGPQMEVGHIIRLHRLTVQMEWDAGVSENAMVLSTSAHHNYVIFKETDKKYSFSYETCANAITIGDYDRLRVGELQVFKSNRTNQTLANEVSSKEGARHTSTIKDIDSAISDALKKSDLSHAVAGSQDLNSQTSTTGVCTSELVSPMNSELGNSLECSQNGHGLQDPVRIERVRSPSEDSFSSALSALSVTEAEIDNRQTSPSCIDGGMVINHDAQQRPICLSANMNFDNPLNPSTTSATEAQNLHLDFTLFKNLRKTDQKLNLLCQIVTLGATSNNNVWHLFIKDLEHTLPSDEFNQPALDSYRGDGVLELNIINAKSLVDRNIVSSLYNDQGTDDFYMIEDVKIKGDEPPYCLEIDGKTCNIKRYNHLMQYLHLEDSFSESRPCETESEILDSLENNLLCEDDITRNSHNESQNQPGPSSHCDAPTSKPSPARRNLGTTGRTSPPSSQSSAYVTAPQTPSPKPATAAEVFGDNQRRTVSRKLEVWTGKSKGKRKPREHYQPEESFDC
ncbi:unnamed protein product [Orchesella dallaii]|uniref:Uncharacterized protein n=1 Tax=Orchesella dallaii TaxID=48710 RepID=A0ABP1PS04_9HEXA